MTADQELAQDMGRMFGQVQAGVWADLLGFDTAATKNDVADELVRRFSVIANLSGIPCKPAGLAGLKRDAIQQIEIAKALGVIVEDDGFLALAETLVPPSTGMH